MTSTISVTAAALVKSFRELARSFARIAEDIEHWPQDQTTEGLTPYAFVFRYLDLNRTGGSLLVEAVKAGYLQQFAELVARHENTAAVGRSVQRRGNSQRLPGEFALVMVGVRGDNAQGYEYHRELVSAHAAGPCSGLWSAGRCCAGGWTITRSRPAVCGCAGLMEWLSAIPWPRRRRICPTWGSRRASTA